MADKVVDIGVDIGGTFTDVVCVEENKNLHAVKIPTTPGDPISAIREGLQKILQLSNVSPQQIRRVIHGTTVGTNALLQQKGSKIGILMTEGFEDVLEIGRQTRTDLFNLLNDPETPGFLAPRRMRKGIRERVSYAGEILVPLDDQQVGETVRLLRERFNVEAIAVCYLHSYANPEHEVRTKEIIQREFPGLEVSISSEVDPTFREYERLCLTAFDAYIKPEVKRYLDAFSLVLSEMGIGAVFQTIQSRGGIASSETAKERPVSLLLAGPAAGVMGGKFAGEQSGYHNLITVDIGGTSCDVSLVSERKPLVSREGKIGTYPLRLPMVDVNSIGAGGGSVAWVDPSGGLRVGPYSAGADPGPACYGRGGTEATVTDASLVLGYLNPESFAGDIVLDKDAAWRAVEKVAKALGLEVPQAAYGIHRIINSNMAGNIHLISIGRGYDPRQFVLVLQGGAGPVHGAALARDLSIPVAVVPSLPGVLSAFGLLYASVEDINSKTLLMKADQVDYELASQVFTELERIGVEQMRKEGIPVDELAVSKSVDMRCIGQSYELDVPIKDSLSPESIEKVLQDFSETHKMVYGHYNPEALVEFVNLRTVHFYSYPRPEIPFHSAASSFDQAYKGNRPAYYHKDGGYVPTPVYERTGLPVGEEKEGPAIIEQYDTTTVVYPKQSFHVDQVGNLIIKT